MIKYEIGTGIRYLSVCDGIGAAHLAWQPLGWSCVGVSEIAAFPKAVVRHRYGFRHLGDMTRFRVWPERLLADVDLLAGGTPCPSFSKAGKRRGLDDERGILALEFAALYLHINRIRREYGRPPAVLLWENVDGALTMNDNSFGHFVGRLLECDEVPRTKSGKWHKAGLIVSQSARVGWRVFDAQHFAVAQRRNRVFVLGVPRELIEHFGERACPSRILSLHSAGEMKPLKVTGRGITEASSIEKPSESVDGSVSLPWLKGVPGSFSLPQGVSLSKVLETGPVDPKYYVSKAAKALTMLQRAEKRGKRLPPLYEEVLMKLAQGTQGVADDLAVQAAMEYENRVALAIDGFNQSISKELHHALRVGRDSNDAVVVLTATSEVAGTLTACHGNGFRSNGIPSQGAAIEGDQLRILTPREWERLMGVPDDFTLVPYRKKKPAKDSPRYTGLGNSIVVPILNWLGHRIDQGFATDVRPRSTNSFI